MVNAGLPRTNLAAGKRGRASGWTRKVGRRCQTRSEVGSLPLRALAGEGQGEGCHTETELNFKFYRQATSKIVGLSEHAAMFLGTLF